MDIALLIVGILLLLLGVGTITRGSLPVILSRARLINLATSLNLIGVVVAAAGLALTIYFGVSVSDGEGEGPPSQVTATPVLPSPSPTLVSVPSSTPTTEPAPTSTLTGPWVEITIPRDGDSVTVGIRVEGQSSHIAAGQVPDTAPPWIYVVVRPYPGRPDQSWWVQPYPLIRDDGSWDAFIFVGQTSDPVGTPFDICAIASSESLPVGRYGGEPPPAITRDCVSVTR